MQVLKTLPEACQHNTNRHGVSAAYAICPGVQVQVHGGVCITQAVRVCACTKFCAPAHSTKHPRRATHKCTLTHLARFVHWAELVAEK